MSIMHRCIQRRAGVGMRKLLTITHDHILWSRRERILRSRSRMRRNKRREPISHLLVLRLLRRARLDTCGRPARPRAATSFGRCRAWPAAQRIRSPGSTVRCILNVLRHDDGPLRLGSICLQAISEPGGGRQWDHNSTYSFDRESPSSHHYHVP